MDAKVVWKNKMSFDGSSDSGFTIPWELPLMLEVIMTGQGQWN